MLSDGLKIRDRKVALEHRQVKLNDKYLLRWVIHDIDHSAAYHFIAIKAVRMLERYAVARGWWQRLTMPNRRTLPIGSSPKFGQFGAIQQRAPGAGPCLRSRAWNSHQLSGAIGRAGVHQPLDRRRAHRSGDRRAYVSNKGVSIEPKPGDVIVEANVVRTWRVVNVQSVAPAGIVVFWDLQARA